MNTISQNRLRDIQGEVMQKPPIKETSKWSIKSIGDVALGTNQDILFNENGKSVVINPPPVKGKGVIDAVYQSPRGPVVYKGLNKDGKDIYVPFEG